MYEQYYGFKYSPFDLVPNLNLLYLSAQHQNALTCLEYGIQKAIGFTLLTGEIGTGKSTLVRYLLKKLDSKIRVAHLFNTNISADDLLYLLFRDFEIELPQEAGKVRLMELFYAFLVETRQRQQHVMVLIDEAQNLADPVLEELRMLSNLQADTEILMQVILVGQPDLRRRLARPNMKQLAQRIGANYHLNALTEEETISYINYRLEKAGGPKGLFTDAAAIHVHRLTDGIPRMINQVCDAALVYGVADELQQITDKEIESVYRDQIHLQTEEPLRNVSPKTSIDANAPAGDTELVRTLQQQVSHLNGMIKGLIRKQGDEQRHVGEELIRHLKLLLLSEREKNQRLVMQKNHLIEREKNLMIEREKSRKILEKCLQMAKDYQLLKQKKAH